MRLSLAQGLIFILGLSLACKTKRPSRPDFPLRSDNSTAPTFDPVIPSTPTVVPQTPAETQIQSLAFSPLVTAITVKNAKGEAPQKGDALKITYSLKNEGMRDGEVKIGSLLSSSRFTDFVKVPLNNTVAKIAAGATLDVTVDVPVFLEDSAKKSRFALGRGSYQLDTVVEFEGTQKALDKPFMFEIAKGNGVFALVVYDKKYFDVGAAVGANPEAWIIETMTRKGSIYYPATATKKTFKGGFDEMLGIKHIVKAVGGLNSEDAPGVDVFTRPEELAKSWLNLSKKWDHGSGPGDNKHGYDYFIAIDKDAFGGVTFGAAQVSGAGIKGDVSKERMQILIVHESGHVLGSPHCNPVMDYVMCSGELNDAYKLDGEFVWYESSFQAMKNIFE